MLTADSARRQPATTPRDYSRGVGSERKDGLGAETAAARVGQEIRSVRRERGLTMRQLAARIGTSQPFVSNIENGRIFPSLRTLSLLAAALEVDADQLLPSGERTERVAAATGMRRRRATEPAARRIIGGAGRDLEAYRVELAAGESEPRPFRHGGEEFILVLTGELDLLREGMPAVRLSPGDGMWIDGEVPHRLAGPAESGEGAGIALITVAGSGEDAGAHAT